MSEINLHRDSYNEASHRRSREAESRVRNQMLQRSARRRAAGGSEEGIRVRFIALMARAMGVAEQIAPTSAPTRQTRPTHRHSQ